MEQAESGNRKISRILVILGFLAVVVATSCSRGGERKLSEREADEYRKEGAELVSVAGQNLATVLSEKIQTEGLTGAISFCNMSALKIIDSISKARNVEIGRTSLKHRNPHNKATERQKQILNLFQYNHDEGEEIKPLLDVHFDNNFVVYYQPIYVQSLCLNCHGTKDNGLLLSTFDTIRHYYPKDRAFNYSLGDLRGMWYVKMNLKDLVTSND